MSADRGQLRTMRLLPFAAAAEDPPLVHIRPLLAVTISCKCQRLGHMRSMLDSKVAVPSCFRRYCAAPADRHRRGSLIRRGRRSSTDVTAASGHCLTNEISALPRSRPKSLMWRATCPSRLCRMRPTLAVDVGWSHTASGLICSWPHRDQDLTRKSGGGRDDQDGDFPEEARAAAAA